MTLENKFPEDNFVGLAEIFPRKIFPQSTKPYTSEFRVFSIDHAILRTKQLFKH